MNQTKLSNNGVMKVLIFSRGVRVSAAQSVSYFEPLNEEQITVNPVSQKHKFSLTSVMNDKLKLIKEKNIFNPASIHN